MVEPNLLKPLNIVASITMHLGPCACVHWCARHKDGTHPATLEQLWDNFCVVSCDEIGRGVTLFGGTHKSSKHTLEELIVMGRPYAKVGRTTEPGHLAIAQTYVRGCVRSGEGQPVEIQAECIKRLLCRLQEELSHACSRAAPSRNELLGAKKGLLSSTCSTRVESAWMRTSSNADRSFSRSIEPK